MELLFDPEFEGSGILNEEESRHAISVLRHKNGDILTITNGKGSIFEAEILDNHPKKCRLQLVREIQEKQPSPRLHMAVAPTKNIDRFEWFLEKATELGIQQITPIICDHSERDKVRIDRLEKVIIAAMKQSVKCYIPKLNDPVEAKKLIDSSTEASRYILHCRKKNMIRLIDQLPHNTDSLILIGPEGDFSVGEIELALSKGYAEAGLGNNRLRTETAALAACHIFNLKNGN
jgi:16S rRNA (uracil1498-N3)-methyltransferase